MSILKNYRQIFERAFSGHILTVELDTPSYKAYMLRESPSSRLNGVLILFTPEGILITGDHAPKTNGCIKSFYGLEWFSGELSEDYLAGKFLEKALQKELVPEELRALAHGTDARTELLRVADEVESGSLDGADLYQALQEIYHEHGLSIGFGHAPQERAKLGVIQRKFRELYLSMNNSTTPTPSTITA
jgi:hypothetical protein